MSVFGPVSERIRNGESAPWYLDVVLAAATPLFRAGMALRAIQTPVRVDARVVSFGNLTAGGTGKTPAVIERAQIESAAGHRVAVLTRGYGATKRLHEVVCVDGANAVGMADVVGDEPVLIARRVPQAVIVRSADRVAAAHKAIEQHGCSVLLLDDGFQYLRLARDENVLVIDATNPFGNGHTLPRGVLREPAAAAARATHVVLTHCDRATRERIGEIESRIKSLCAGAPVRRTFHKPDALWAIDSGEAQSLATLQSKEVVALCAIARPDSFVTTLKSLGARVVEQRSFPDHALIPGDALRADRWIITTEKDAARIGTAPPNVYALGVRLADIDT